jgi:DNA-binding ferritin-like protein
MEKENYNDCQKLINSIDHISESAKTLSDSLTEYFLDANRKAKFITYAGGNNVETVLTDDEVYKVVAIILKTYVNSIAECRKSLDAIVKNVCDSIYDDIEKLEE